LGKRGTCRGVFEDNPTTYAQITFWSLKYEVLCYGALAWLGLAGVLRSKSDFGFVLMLATLFWVVFLFVGSNVGGILPAAVMTFNKLAFVFLLGMAAHTYRHHIYLSGIGVAGLIAATWALWWTPVFHALMPLTIAYGVLWAAYVPGGRIRGFNRLGDYSYGIYIFGVPVQQVMVLALGDQSAFANFVFAFGPTLGLAVISWHVVENPSLGLRARLAPARPRRAALR